jgi:hypothetical protein
MSLSLSLSLELLDIFCVSGFSGQLIPWLCHSLTLKLFLLTFVLASRTCGPGLVVLLLVLFLLP